MKALKVIEILENLKKEYEEKMRKTPLGSYCGTIDILYLKNKLIDEAIAGLEIQQRYIQELESDAVSLQNEYSNKCKELEALENRSCDSCMYFHIDNNKTINDIQGQIFSYGICSNLKLNIASDFYCNKYKQKD